NKLLQSPEEYRSISILYLTGIAIKLGLFPFHSWKINVYQHSSPLISIFMLPVTQIPLIFLLFKLGFLSNAFVDLKSIYLFASISIILAPIAALKENNFMKIVTYSSISFSGYILLLWLVLKRTDGVMLLNLILAEGLIKISLLTIPFGLSNAGLHINNITFFCGANRSFIEKTTFCSIIFIFLNAAAAPLTLLFFFKIEILELISSTNLFTCGIILISSVIWFRVYTNIMVNIIATQSTQDTTISSNKSSQEAIIFLASVISFICLNSNIIEDTGVLFMKGY
ncbi:MAG: proton-conducting transporter membrane subunit, partial [Rickettsiaceae bacterium]|nr:proton-conducting transporter membrane subunit [Rickettsiaceae bacterium]